MGVEPTTSTLARGGSALASKAFCGWCTCGGFAEGSLWSGFTTIRLAVMATAGYKSRSRVLLPR
jgi:hypothetical protein